MKTDLDRLMQIHDIDAILVVGPGRYNPPMVYLTGGAPLTYADLIKKRGQAPVLFHYSMERDEATRTGLPTRDLREYRFQDLLRQSGGDLLKAEVARYQHMFQDLDLISGRVAIFGQRDAGRAFALFSALQEAMPGLTLVGEYGASVLSSAMMTKDWDEVERIRQVGQITTAVVGQVADFLTSHGVKNDTLVKSDGEPLTIGEVKRCIYLWLAERNAETPEGMTFSIGYDAAVPHSTGTASDPLRLGQTIVFDIFPCEQGGGYFYDLTRTWCLGYATDEALRLYEDVLSVYRQILRELRPGAACSNYQERACELFAARGHPTVKENPATQDGYVHGLGHGVGLHIHESPIFQLVSRENECLEHNVVVAIEPGLYYPARGLGVRLEDTIWLRPDGVTEVLAPYPHDLVLPVK